MSAMPPMLRSALSLLVLASTLSAQPASVKVWVNLADKGPDFRAPAAAASAASRRAYENRPVYAPYLDSLARSGFALAAALKWQNRVSGKIEASRLPALRALSFVTAVEPLLRRKRRAAVPPPSPLPNWPLAKRAAAIDYGAETALFDSLGIARLHRWMDANEMRPGAGMRVAVIDADFHLGSAIYTDLKTRIRDQWDFAGHRPQAVDDSLEDSHGAECLSLIGGNAPGTLVGAAPAAEFMLYRAEINDSELYAEEDYVAAAIERAVDSGAQVISISLGYRWDFDLGEPDIPYSQLDGRTRPASLAALGAARRNVVVSVAMGNEAESHPEGPNLGTPADADSILSLGIVNSDRARCGYSSIGPSADGRIKPEIVSMGLIGGCAVAVAYPDTAPPHAVAYSGTSFATPVAAAAAALLRQARPEASAEQIRQALLRTADHADHPDNQTGYGVMDVAAAAISLGVPLKIELIEKGHARLFHPGGEGPIFVAWDPHRAQPPLELTDLSGRRVPISVNLSGSVLALKPARNLPTGVYMARIP
ncbi:MAG: S8 family serine peptidase [Fibrobacteres bacterium]|nr:S8 family serine peptidase [Fibrobacterota bacterium]